jgi:hypothetical protein
MVTEKQTGRETVNGAKEPVKILLIRQKAKRSIYLISKHLEE